jgi:N-acetylmuramoyl-L-alanine amidase
MKWAGLCFFLLAGLLSVSPQNALSKPERTSLSGNEYVRLTDWARVHQLQSAWTRSEQEVQLTGQGTKLVFTVDSQRVAVNGVTVFLCCPLILRNGFACIAVLDLQATLQPILFPPKNDRVAPILNICLDPGHGGKDPGNEEGQRKEKEYALMLAGEVKSRLTAAGLKVSLTRQIDRFVPLYERPEIARGREAELFVSLHFNAAIADRNNVKGVEVYCLTPAGARSTYAQGEPADMNPWKGNRLDGRNMMLAYQIQGSLVRSLSVEDRGVRRARFAVLKTAEMPAVLIEAGFMSHPTEGKQIFDAAYRRQLAQAIADGIMAYKRLVDP